MKLKAIASTLLSFVTITGGGFLLFNLGFLAFAAVVNTTMQASGQPENDSPRALALLLGYAAIGIITFLGLKFSSSRKQFKDTLRAMFLTLPLMALLVLLGISLHQQPDVIILAVGAVIILPILAYLYKKKLAWQYWVAVLYVAALGILVAIKDIQI